MIILKNYFENGIKIGIIRVFLNLVLPSAHPHIFGDQFFLQIFCKLESHCSLSYTTFAYGTPRLYKTSGAKNAPIKVTFTVTNTGKRAGATVPQIYIGKPSQQGIPVPPKELAGFRKIYLCPGETKTVTITVEPRQLAYWNTQADRFVVMPGLYRIYLGSNVNNTPSMVTYTVR